MAEAYGWDTIERCEDLYILNGLTFSQVAERTGVNVATIKRWSAASEPSWTERRRGLRQKMMSTRFGLIDAKHKLIEAVVDTLDPQLAYAFKALVSSSAVLEKEAMERAATLPPVVSMVDVEIGADENSSQDSDENILRKVKGRISQMLTQPGALTIDGVDKAYRLWEKLRGQSGGETDKAAPSAETIREWHEMLGL